MGSRKDFDKAKETVEAFAKNIAEEVINARFYEVDRIKAIATTRLSFAIHELLKMSLLDYEEDRRVLVAEYNRTDIPGWKKEKLKEQIAELNFKMKQKRRIDSTFEDYSMLDQMKHFIIDKFGKDVLLDFTQNYYDKDQNAIHISRRTQKTDNQ